MNKTTRLGLILTEKEKQWVVQLGELEGGLSLSAVIRRLIRIAAQQYDLPNDTGKLAQTPVVGRNGPVN